MNQEEQEQIILSIRQARQEISKRKRYNSQERGDSVANKLQIIRILESPHKEKTLSRASSTSRLNQSEVSQQNSQQSLANVRIGARMFQKVQKKNIPGYKLDAAELLVDRLKKMYAQVNIQHQQKQNPEKAQQQYEQKTSNNSSQNSTQTNFSKNMNTLPPKFRSDMIKHKHKKSQGTSLAEIQKLIEQKQAEIQIRSHNTSMISIPTSPNHLTSQTSFQMPNSAYQKNPIGLFEKQILNRKGDDTPNSLQQFTKNQNANLELQKNIQHQQHKYYGLLKKEDNNLLQFYQKKNYTTSRNDYQPERNQTYQTIFKENLTYQDQNNLQFQSLSFLTEISQVLRKCQRRLLKNS